MIFKCLKYLTKGRTKSAPVNKPTSLVKPLKEFSCI